MKKFHKVQGISFHGDIMALKVDGKEHRISISRISTRLLNAGEAERNHYKVSPSGFGIHWPALDEDLSIDGLIGRKQKKIGRSRILISE